MALTPVQSVTLVGAGIVNLMTGLQLVRHGYQLQFFDQAPDPRDNACWTSYGCTRGGGDGRMFTLTEADSYNIRSRNSDGTCNDLLQRPVSAGGWLIAPQGGLSEPEHRWAAEFHQVPPQLAQAYTSDIFGVNRAAATGWQDLAARDPELFDDVGYSEGILRLYNEADYFRWHLERNQRLGAVNRVLTADELAAAHPALEPACDAGAVAGAMEVMGFTVNIHAFVARLVTVLEREGAQFHWEQAVTGIAWAAPDLIEGVQTASGVVRSRHYVLSPGAYGDSLLQGTASYRQIQGMVGVWLTVPNVAPALTHSVKIARKGHTAEETNVTLATDPNGQPTLVFGSGYGWTGTNPGNIDPTQLEVLFDALDDTIRQFFPKAYFAGVAGGTLQSSRQLCVRPWTASCLGIFEQIKAVDGGVLVVAGGHNTGGFTQSPVVAQAVLHALEHREHSMHTQYHPQRLRRYYDGDSRE